VTADYYSMKETTQLIIMNRKGINK